MFTRDLFERVIATFVQAALGALGTNSLLDLGVDNWKLVVSAGAAAALSVIKAAVAKRLGTPGTASLVD